MYTPFGVAVRHSIRTHHQITVGAYHIRGFHIMDMALYDHAEW